MEECHVCGNPASARGKVEGVTVWLCRKCVSFGTAVSSPPQTSPRRQGQPSGQYSAPPRPAFHPVVHSIAAGAGAQIAAAREKLGLSRKQLAAQIFIMENVLERIENGHLTPDIKTASKLEKALKIRLVAEESASEGDEEKVFMGGKDIVSGSALADVIDVKVKK
ncbi:MAG: multiprotein-bridging factor 1 family protein [Candidatus Micrarchaeota archaeon]